MNPAEYDKDTKIHDLRRETNPVTGASSVSWYTFWWLKPLFETGLKRPIDETDIYETLSTHQSSQLSYQFESYWKAEQKSSKQPSFLRVICRIYWRSILGYGAMYTIVDLLARYDRVVPIPSTCYMTCGCIRLSLQNLSTAVSWWIGSVLCAWPAGY